MAKVRCESLPVAPQFKFSICRSPQHATSSLLVFWYCASIWDTNQMKCSSAVAHVQAHSSQAFTSINFIVRSRWDAVDSFMEFLLIQLRWILDLSRFENFKSTTNGRICFVKTTSCSDRNSLPPWKQKEVFHLLWNINSRNYARKPINFIFLFS